MPKRSNSKGIIRDIGIVVVAVVIMWIGIQVIFGTEMLTLEGNQIKVGGPFYVVVSGSMIPVLQVYDIIVIQGHDTFEEVEIGDIIVFDRPSDHNRVIVHRVVSITNEDPRTIRTQGDANPGSIPGTDFPITEEEYIGKFLKILTLDEVCSKSSEHMCLRMKTQQAEYLEGSPPTPVAPTPVVEPVVEPNCGIGTEDLNGICQTIQTKEKSNNGGFFLNYVNDEPKFSIDYPYGWTVEERRDNESVLFYSDDYTTWLRVDYVSWSFYDAVDLSEDASDNEIKLNMIQNTEDILITMCNEDEDSIVICGGFEIEEIKKIKSEPPTFRATFSYFKQYKDTRELISYEYVVTMIIDKDAYWLIRSSNSPNLYQPQEGQVRDSIKLLTSMDSFVSPTFEKYEQDIILDKLGIASFVDQTKDPQHYIDRYNNEPTYKEWFDENYSQYGSIEQAVGYDEWSSSGTFSIDKQEYHLGEKIFITANLLPEDNGTVQFLRPISDTRHEVYIQIPFDGMVKSKFNYYFEPKYDESKGICSIDDIAGNWIVKFSGTPYEDINFEILAQTSSWDERTFEPIC